MAEIIGRRKDGATIPAGSVTALGKFRALLRAASQYFRAVLGTVEALKRAKRGGGGQDFEALVNKILGVDEQVAYDESVAAEAEAIAKEADLGYTPPTDEEMEGGVAFRL